MSTAISPNGRPTKAPAVHALAEYFPLIEGEEFDQLVADIKTNGLLEPIVLFEGKILDGRNRARACEKAGVEPRYEKFEGKDARAYVISKNITRRHLEKSQKAILGLQLLPSLMAEAKERISLSSQRHRAEFQGKRVGAPTLHSDPGPSTTHAAQLVGVSDGYMKMARRIQKEAPHLLETIRRGEMTLNKAEAIVRRKEREANPKPKTTIPLDEQIAKRVLNVLKPFSRKDCERAVILLVHHFKLKMMTLEM